MATIRKGLDKRLARSPAVQAELQRLAETVLEAAKARAAKHSDSGTFAASLSVKRGRVDRRVESDDPLALAKEYGHDDARTGRHIDGAHVLTGTAADIAARS